MMDVIMEPLKHKPKCRVQLHIHLDGAVRHETLWEIMRKKGMKLPGSGSLSDFQDALRVEEPRDLAYFLKGFKYFLDCLIGDLDVIERISYEFVEDQAKQSVAYCEARFCPHLLLPGDAGHLNGSVNGSSEASSNGNGIQNGSGNVQSDDIVKAVLKGIKRGEEDFGTKVRLILCCIRGNSQWAWDILRLCEEYRDQGVVAIDIAGDEAGAGEEASISDPVDIAVFQAAKEKGIHRTVHAGEAGPASCVQVAVEAFGAERIGHGYRVIEDEAIYDMCKREGIHFETCPHSSYLTGAVKSLKCTSKRHPVLRFAEDEASFSISTDDPTITFTTLSDEYRLLGKWGFTEAQITRANFQAALHSFLSPEEKRDLVEQLKEAYGIIDYSLPVASPSSRRTSTPLKPSVTFGTWAERT
ncbi:adenosine deaminase-like isoform X5 [Macrobrachium rosenbergii]|uniref:adenosine deaminase-like isoform X5 n=1 Tax=Macrobrachium rosenbergii TaxID=79674 RepID=UPI0034D4EAB6